MCGPAHSGGRTAQAMEFDFCYSHIFEDRSKYLRRSWIPNNLWILLVSKPARSELLLGHIVLRSSNLGHLLRALRLIRALFL